MMRVAAVQLTSTADRQANLEAADRLTREAAAGGADLVVLPEKWSVLGTPDDLLAGAETLDGPSITWARATARELGIDLVAGSIVERRADRERLSNTCVHVGPDGEVREVYRKVHLFDVQVGGRVYRESALTEPGTDIVLSEARGVPLGLGVCYDLRFPELFRVLTLRGARVIVLPAAFTRMTGAAHWEVLVRARAIENQVFVVAADQVGRHPGDLESFGGSTVVGPWGEVLGVARDTEAVVLADLDLARQDEVRRRLPSLEHRVPDLYARPEAAPVRAATGLETRTPDGYPSGASG